MPWSAPFVLTIIVLVAPGLAAAQTSRLLQLQQDRQEGTSYDDVALLSASELIGTSVYRSDDELTERFSTGTGEHWEEVGEITDILLTREGTIEGLVLEVGGFLGLGSKSVAITMNDLLFVTSGLDSSDYFILYRSAPEVLEDAPAYEGDRLVRVSNRTESAAVTATEDTEAEGPATTEEGVTSGRESAMVADQPDAQPDDDSASAEAETISLTRPDLEIEGYEPAEMSALSADAVTGARVYDVSDQWIGEVAQLLVDDQGQIKQAVIEVGGFLGLGEKPIALEFDTLNIQQAQTGDRLRVYIDASEEDLQAMPVYEDTTE